MSIPLKFISLLPLVTNDRILNLTISSLQASYAATLRFMELIEEKINKGGTRKNFLIHTKFKMYLTSKITSSVIKIKPEQKIHKLNFKLIWNCQLF